MLIGYARVSTRDQKPHLQLDALQEAGCERVFEETASGAKRDRPELKAVLDFMRAGDNLVVWKLDRLARSTRQLLETVEALELRGIGLKILTQNIDTTNAGGRLILRCSRRSPNSSARSSANARALGSMRLVRAGVRVAVHERCRTRI